VDVGSIATIWEVYSGSMYFQNIGNTACIHTV
jgi:hypothetical protein